MVFLQEAIHHLVAVALLHIEGIVVLVARLEDQEVIQAVLLGVHPVADLHIVVAEFLEDAGSISVEQKFRIK